MRCRAFLSLLLLSCASGEDWNRFRGPNGSGVATDGEYPNELSRERNLIWRTPARPAKSSPVLTNRHVFLTASADNKLYTQCFDRETGKLLWERSEPRPRDQMSNGLNHPAALSPVTDGENVYSFFQDYGLISYTSDGSLRWKTPLGPFATVMGLGASPVIAGDSVIILADQVEEKSFIAAIARSNGELRWRIARDEGEGWGTPLVLNGIAARPIILTAGRGQLGAYLLDSGKRIISDRSIATTIVASPILQSDTMYVFGYGSDTPAPFSRTLARLDRNQDGKISSDEYGSEAFVRGIATFVGNRDLIVTEDEWNAKQREVMGPNRLIAIQFERGDSPEAPLRVRELWRYDKNFTGVIPSPLLLDGVLYIARNGGILTSFDAKSGEVLKMDRVTGALGGYSASPVGGDGKVYLASEDGHLAVIKGGKQWEVISVNELGESIFATPALSQGRVYLRTSEALYCFGSKSTTH